VPLVARWPGHIPAGTRSAEMISLTDMLATFAAVLGRELGPDDGPDSFNALPALLGEPGHAPVRPYLTMIGTGGIAIREGRWLLVPKHGSCGFSTDPDNPWLQPWKIGRTNSDYTADGELKPDAPAGQLYDLASDPQEATNRYAAHPEIVERLSALLVKLKKDGRSRQVVHAHGPD